MSSKNLLSSTLNFWVLTLSLALWYLVASCTSETETQLLHFLDRIGWVSVHWVPLNGRIGKMVASHAEGCKVARSNSGCGRFILCTRGSGGTTHDCGGVTIQLDLQTLTPLYVASSGRLQLGVPHWATSVDYCKYSW